MDKLPVFGETLKELADANGIALLQRFDIVSASLFLGCSKESIRKLADDQKLSFIQICDENIAFFGYQLLEYLYNSVSAVSQFDQKPIVSDRILRSSEVYEMTGVSRVTIWRWERERKFPARVRLGPNSVGWLESDIQNWIRSKEKV